MRSKTIKTKEQKKSCQCLSLSLHPMSSPLPHDSIKPFNSSEKSKKEEVEIMFDRIAGGYDFMNRFLSARIDVLWRKKAISFLKKQNPRLILDMATGTADMAILACKKINPEKIIGIDLSEGMLEIGRKKVEKEGLSSKIELRKGDAETINAPDNSFDAIMVAFGVRNFENLEKGLSELRRVLKPGGNLVILEFSKPKNGIIKAIYNWYMSKLAPGLAKQFKQDKEAYSYLNKSANAFPDRELLTHLLSKQGFTDANYSSLTMGICCLYTARK
jgi:demethylmenaquinone methyltransferase/2-methoxy-6-polyprenyl-1,4-benzoquinol methylase